MGTSSLIAQKEKHQDSSWLGLASEDRNHASSFSPWSFQLQTCLERSSDAPASVWTVRTPDFSVSPGLLGDAHFHSIFLNLCCVPDMWHVPLMASGLSLFWSVVLRHVRWPLLVNIDVQPGCRSANGWVLSSCSGNLRQFKKMRLKCLWAFNCRPMGSEFQAHFSAKGKQCQTS